MAINWLKNDHDPFGKVTANEESHDRGKKRRLWREAQTEHHTQMSLAGKYNRPLIEKEDVQKWIILGVFGVIGIVIFLLGFNFYIKPAIESQRIIKIDPYAPLDVGITELIPVPNISAAVNASNQSIVTGPVLYNCQQNLVFVLPSDKSYFKVFLMEGTGQAFAKVFEIEDKTLLQISCPVGQNTLLIVGAE